MDTVQNDLNAKLVRNNFQGGNLLVVEDNEDHWYLLRHSLQTTLPEVKLSWVTSAQEATDYLQDRVTQQLSLPRLIILDLYLPLPETGFSLLKSIKTTSALRLIPIVILSSSNHLKDIGQAYELGASSYFTKPTQLSEWRAYSQAIFDYWGLTVTLPDNYPRY